MTRGLLSLTGLLLALHSMPVRVQAQTDTEVGRVPNRYLFVVETSRTMQRRAEGVVAAAQDLVNSGFRGQLRQGDTLGVWTFNAELATGQFPLEEWSSEARATIAIHLLTFLQGQTYEKQARLDKLWPSLERVLKDSQFITVILISSGEDKLQGTPYDAQINDAWGKWRAPQQQARMPLVTILRASHGQIRGWSVTPAPWDPDLPPLPAELQVAQAQPTARPDRPPQTSNSTPVARAPSFKPVPHTNSAPSEVAAAATPTPKPLPSTNTLTTLTTAARPPLDDVPPATTPTRPPVSTGPAAASELKPAQAAVAPLASAAVQGQPQAPGPTPSNPYSKPVTPPPLSVPPVETVAQRTEPHPVPASSQENSGVIKEVQQANVPTPPGNAHPETAAAATAQASTMSSRSATNQPTAAATPASTAENSTKSETAQAAAPQSQAANVEVPAKSDSQVGAQAFPAAGTGQTRGAFDVVRENVIWLGLVVVTSALAGFCFFRWLQGFLGRRAATAEAPVSEPQSEGDAEQLGTEAEQPGKLLAEQRTSTESHAPERAPGAPVRR
jgi:hypothetical protein